MLQPDQNHTLIIQSDPNNRGLQLARNNYSYSTEVRTIALAWSVVGITPNIDLSIAQSPHLYRGPQCSLNNQVSAGR